MKKIALSVALALSVAGFAVPASAAVTVPPTAQHHCKHHHHNPCKHKHHKGVYFCPIIPA